MNSAHHASSSGRNPGAALSAFPRQARRHPLQGQPISSPCKTWELDGILTTQSSFLLILPRLREKPKGSESSNGGKRMQQDGEQKLARATRKDKGRPRWTERDDYCLWWVGEQRAVRYDQLQRLLARESDHETARPGWLSASRTIQTIQRWQKGGLAHYIKPYARRPGFVYLSRKGLRFAELDYRYSEPRESQLTHLSYINQARLKLEEEYDDEEGEWISERAILAEQERRSPGQRAPARARRHLRVRERDGAGAGSGAFPQSPTLPARHHARRRIPGGDAQPGALLRVA